MIHVPRWQGAPGVLTLLSIGQLSIRLTRWNNLAGGHGAHHIGPAHLYWRFGNPLARNRWQAVMPLRPFKVGRRSLYLKVMWGFTR